MGKTPQQHHSDCSTVGTKLHLNITRWAVQSPGGSWRTTIPSTSLPSAAVSSDPQLKRTSSLQSEQSMEFQKLEVGSGGEAYIQEIFRAVLNTIWDFACPWNGSSGKGKVA